MHAEGICKSLQIGVASVIHPFKTFFSTYGGGFPSTRRVISSGLKVAKGGRSSSRVSPWNLSVNFSNTTFVAGQRHIMWSSSPIVPVARQCGHTRSEVGSPLEPVGIHNEGVKV